MTDTETESPRPPALDRDAENFLRQLENRMLTGASDSSNRHWAMYDCGVPEESYIRIKALILRSWRIDSSTYTKTIELRDVTGAQYLYIYNVALERGNLGAALKALDSFARLHGLDQPSLAPQTLGNGGITNSVRESVLKLMTKMEVLSNTSSIRTIDVITQRNSNGARLNGSNGNGNGHKHLPMGADAEDNEGD